MPADEEVVLQSGLPTTDPRTRQLRALATELAKRPDDRQLAMELAGRQLSMGVAEADPRFVGYAQATLARWWQDRSPASLVVLRARILQAQHNFADAAADLRAALRENPENPQALLVLASVDEVTGDLNEAKSACETFARVRPGLTATACRASVESLTGNALASEAALTNAVRRAPPRDRAQHLWALTILCEIAVRIDDPAADQYFAQAFALDNRNVYLLTAYSDYLLGHGRPADVVRRLTGLERIDALYLRLAIAARAIGDTHFAAYRDDLAARYAAARRQGDILHLRDASRYALEIEGDGRHALAFAQQNWSTHKTPEDARAVVAAAIACRDQEAARPIAEWAARTHLEDHSLWLLLKRLSHGAEDGGHED
ncbi:MAG: tetratricopeptide repeat protein [Stellaceae bacterium]